MGRARAVFDQPLVAYRVLMPLLVVFWFVSGVGQSDDPDGVNTSQWAWVGSTAWLLFGLTVVTTVLFTIVLLVRRILHRTTTA